MKFVGYQNLIQRNQQLYGNGNAPSGGVALPFILVQVPLLWLTHHALFPHVLSFLSLYLLVSVYKLTLQL